jgi:hypothetical protein
MAKATQHDAELILKLYDLRREAEMRKARNWIAAEFWPNTFEDYVKVMSDMGSDHNRWVRQVVSFWEMAAALAVHGAIDQELFLEPSVSGEMFFVYTKLKPILAEVREKMNSPEFLANSEKLITGTETGRARAKAFEQRVAMLKQRMMAQKAKA